MESLEILGKQHGRVLIAIDSLDQKIAQTISVDGVILSFVFDKAKTASSMFIFYVGLILIVLGLVICLYTFRAQIYKDSPKPSLYSEQKEKDILKALRALWIKGLEYNIKIQEMKANFLNFGLYFSVAGLIAIVVGYYV